MNQDKELYKSNIKKAYIYKFLQSFNFLSAILIPFFTLWGGLNFKQIMILQAIFTFSIFLLEIPTGVLADKLGRKVSLSLAGLATAIGFLIYASYPNFWIFALGEFILAISASLISGADQAMVYDSLREIKKEKQSKKIFGRFNSIGLLALMVAAPIGSLIAKYFGLRAVMLAMLFPNLIMFIFALTFKEPEIGRKISKKRSYLKTFKRGFSYFRCHKILRIMAIDYISISTLAFFLIWVYQVKLQALNIDIGKFGFVHSAIVIVQILVLNTFVKFEKLFGGKKKYLFYSAILTGAGFIIIGLAQSFVIVILGILLAAAFGLTRKPLFNSYMNKYITSNERATVLSTISMFYMLTMAVIDIILGYFVDLNLAYTLVAVGLIIIGLSIISKIEEEYLID